MGDSERIAFPPPSSDWGLVTHTIIPNPARRWWSFWRPRTVSVAVMPPFTIGDCTIGSWFRRCEVCSVRWEIGDDLRAIACARPDCPTHENRR